MNDWVSCRERLPEKAGCYLVLIQYFGAYGYFPELMTYTPPGDWRSCKAEGPQIGVSYWMEYAVPDVPPVPVPPEGKPWDAEDYYQRWKGLLSVSGEAAAEAWKKENPAFVGYEKRRSGNE